MIWIKTGFRYSLAFAIAAIICSSMIVAGNDVLLHTGYSGAACTTVLQVDYLQWLPVCVCFLGLAFLAYILLLKLPFPRMKLGWLCLCASLFALSAMLIAGVSQVFSLSPDWYEVKNAASFSFSGVCFALCSELMD